MVKKPDDLLKRFQNLLKLLTTFRVKTIFLNLLIEGLQVCPKSNSFLSHLQPHFQFRPHTQTTTKGLGLSINTPCIASSGLAGKENS